MGRTVKNEDVNALTGDNMHIMALDGIAKGVYIIELRTGDDFNNVKLVVQ